MKAIKSIIAVLVLGTLIASCSSSKKTTEASATEDKQEKTASTESTSTNDTKVEPQKGETLTKGDNREQILKDAIASYPDSLSYMLQRTACYGKCPVYTVKIYASGYATYEGKMNVEKEGMFASKFSKDELESIGKRVDEIKFFEMNNIYDSNVTDFPSTNVYANRGGNKKQIINRQAGPEELKELAKLMDDMANTKEWKKQ